MLLLNLRAPCTCSAGQRKLWRPWDPSCKHRQGRLQGGKHASWLSELYQGPAVSDFILPWSARVWSTRSYHVKCGTSHSKLRTLKSGWSLFRKLNIDVSRLSISCLSLYVVNYDVWSQWCGVPRYIPVQFTHDLDMACQVFWICFGSTSMLVIVCPDDTTLPLLVPWHFVSASNTPRLRIVHPDHP
jgi:hypothetical protein